MANSKRGESEIVLDGRLYKLVFDWNAICEIESALGGRSIDEIFMSGSIPRLALREAVRIGLQRKFKPLPAKNVGQMIAKSIDSPEDFKDLVKAVLSGIMGATGESEETIRSLGAVLDEEAEIVPIPRERDKEDIDISTDPIIPEKITGTG